MHYEKFYCSMNAANVEAAAYHAVTQLYPITSLKLNFLDKYIHTSYKCTNASNLTQYAILFDNSIILA